MLKRGDTAEGVIEEVSYPNKGSFTAEEGQRVYVKNVLPGQRVSVRIKKKREGKAEGRLLAVTAPSPLESRGPACGIFPACGGCLAQTMPYSEQLRMKENELRKLISQVADADTAYDGIIGSPEEFGYRNKMEFSFGDCEKGGPLTLGLHKRGTTYDVLTADTCRLVHPDLTRILSCVLAYCTRENLPQYNRRTHEGYLRYLLLRRSHTSGEVLVYLVTTSALAHDFSPLAEEILSLGMEGEVCGIFHGTGDSAADALKVESSACLFGRDYFFEEMLGLRFKVTAFSFFQTNTRGAELLYGRVREYVAEGLEGSGQKPVIYDLYSGTGTIGQMLSPVARHIYGIELIEEASAAARENAAANALSNCTFIAGDVLKELSAIPERPDFLVLDPPRDGINPKALKQLMECDVASMVYISCKATSFVRDMQAMAAAGWRIKRWSLVDLFPQTPHVETVVLMSKIKYLQ